MDVNKVVLGGSSAGGGLAASLAQMARDKVEVKLVFQLPIFSVFSSLVGSVHIRYALLLAPFFLPPILFSFFLSVSCFSNKYKDSILWPPYQQFVGLQLSPVSLLLILPSVNWYASSSTSFLYPQHALKISNLYFNRTVQG